MFDLEGNCFKHSLNIVLQLHGAVQSSVPAPGPRAQTRLKGTTGRVGGLSFSSPLVIFRLSSRPVLLPDIFCPYNFTKMKCQELLAQRSASVTVT